MHQNQLLIAEREKRSFTDKTCAILFHMAFAGSLLCVPQSFTSIALLKVTLLHHTGYVFNFLNLWNVVKKWIEKQMRILAIALTLGLSLATALASPFPDPPLENGWRPETIGMDHGPYPKAYKKIVQDYARSMLKDPDSAKFVEFSKPRKEHFIRDQFTKDVVYGYSVCALINAKNGFGGYTGPQAYWFLIRDGMVLKSQPARMIIYIGHPTNCQDPGPNE